MLQRSGTRNAGAGCLEEEMKRLLSPRILRHAVFLALLAVYLLSANTIYARFVITHGKPAETNIDLPEASEAAIVKVGYMRPKRVENQDVYELAGFAFLRSNPGIRNRIRVVLQSEDGTNLIFATEPPTAPAMVDSSEYKDFGVEHSEFRAIISKYAIPPGSYTVGVLLDQPQVDSATEQPGMMSGPRGAYTLSGATLRRTHNQMRYTQPPDE